MAYTSKNFLDWNFKLNTMDITIAVVGGVIAMVYISYTPLHLFESMFLSMGVAGWAAFYIYEGIYYTVYIMAGWLRKKAGVLVLSSTVGGVLQTLATGGGGEGMNLILMLFIGGLASGVYLHYANWKKNFLTYFLGGSVFFLFIETTFFITTGWWPEPLILLIGTYILGFITNGILAGYLGKVFADALVKAGIAEIDLEE